MKLINYFRRVFAAQQIGRVVSDITRRSYPLVWNRVRSRAARMNKSEARGYIRARAAEVIDSEMESLMKYAPRLDSWFRMSVRERAIEELTGSILGNILGAQPQESTLRQAA